MPTFEITSPEGKKYQVNAPNGATEQDAIAYVQKNFGAPSAPATEDHGILQNIGLGALKGATNIGSTLLWPLDATGVTGMSHQDRKAALDEVYNKYANPDSIAFKGGELGTSIAGTAGVGGALAAPLRSLGVAAPVATALETGGFKLGIPAAETLAGKAAQMALRTGAGAAVGGASAGLVDPSTAKEGAIIGGALPGTVLAAKTVGTGIKNLVGKMTAGTVGATTGAGGNAISQAYQAGKNGTTEFLDNMRGNVPMTDVLGDAKAALNNMRIERGNAYRSGMLDISKDQTVLDMTPIQKAVSDLASMGNYKGQVINPNASSKVGELAQAVDDWAKLNPADFHTPEGLDALKQKIGDIRDATEYGSPARRAADTVYNAIKGQITQQAPTYAKVMQDYSEASDLVTEIQKSLVGGEKTSADTAMRKLQSLMRNNVNTNYGNRLDLANKLQDQGGKQIIPQIAGQALNSWMPRGMTGAIEKGVGIPGMVAASVTNPVLAAKMALAAPFASPRLMGEAAYGLGAMRNGAGNLMGNTAGLLGKAGIDPALTNPVFLNSLLSTSVPRFATSP